MTRKDTESSPGVLDKVGAILDVLAEHDDLAVAEIAERLDEPRSSIYRLVRSLQDQGLVEPAAARGRFRLGVKLFLLGSRVAARFDGRSQALPLMKELHEETEQTIFYCIRQGGDALCVERVDGRWFQSMALKIGTTLPLHLGGASKALLAFAPREDWVAYVNAPSTAPQVPVASELDAASFLAELEEIRERGYATSDEDIVEGVCALGAPVFDHRGEVCASLSISGLKPSILGSNTDLNARRIMAAAQEISRQLGHSPP